MRRVLLAFFHVLIYFLAVFMVMALAVIPTRIIFGDLEAIELRLQILLLGIQAVLAVAMVNVVLAKAGKSQIIKEGWSKFRPGVRWFGIGALVGLLMCAGVVVISWASGSANLSIDRGGLSRYAACVWPLLLILLILALAEEWIFRGYPLTKLLPVVGREWSNVMVSVLFMACHWGSDGWTALAAVNIFLFSLVNGAMRYTPGGIPAAWGFHFAWNGLHILLGASLSGTDYAVPAVRFVGTGPAWLSGGAYGPEGAIGTTVMAVVGWLLIQRLMWRGDRKRKEIQNIRI